MIKEMAKCTKQQATNNEIGKRNIRRSGEVKDN